MSFENESRRRAAGRDAIYVVIEVSARNASCIALVIGRVATFLLDALIDFFAMHGNVFRRIDSDPYLITFDAEHRDVHIVTDHQ
jgi:hypothetical protein